MEWIFHGFAREGNTEQIANLKKEEHAMRKKYATQLVEKEKILFLYIAERGKEKIICRKCQWAFGISNAKRTKPDNSYLAKNKPRIACPSCGYGVASYQLHLM